MAWSGVMYDTRVFCDATNCKNEVDVFIEDADCSPNGDSGDMTYFPGYGSGCGYCTGCGSELCADHFHKAEVCYTWWANFEKNTVAA